MGLFSFFKKNKQQESKEETRDRLESMFQEMLAKNNWQQPTSIKGADKVKPNRFGNYLFPPEALFVVHGTNPSTNRRNKRRYHAGSEAEAIQKAEADGLTAPFEIAVEPEEEPSDRQLAYAKDLGLQIPKGACKWDVSALISRAEENDENQADPEFLTYLAARGWRGSSLIGYNFSREIVYNFVDNTREQIALCAYHFDQAEKGLALGNMDTAPNKDHYLAFADHVLQNPKALEHYHSWRRDSTWSKAKTWGIYKDYNEYSGEKK